MCLDACLMMFFIVFLFDYLSLSLFRASPVLWELLMRPYIADEALDGALDEALWEAFVRWTATPWRLDYIPD
jgi:hypothetical protein